MKDPEIDVPHPQLRTMQIIAGAMLLGVLVPLVLSLILVLTRQNGQAPVAVGGLPVISIVAVFFIMVNVPISLFLPGVLTKKALSQIAAGQWQPGPEANPSQFATDAAKLLAVRQTALIVGAALLEGAGLFGCVAFFLEGQFFVLCSPVLALLLMALNFPTENAVRSWLQRHLDQLAELRH